MEDHARRVALAALLLAAGAAACRRAERRGEPLAGPMLTTEPSQDRGRLVFMASCYPCHPGGEAGLGPSLNDKKVSPRRVRHHAGAADSLLIYASQLGDKELSDLTAYLAALREDSERLHEPFEAREASR